MFTDHAGLQKTYDAAIIGAGTNGLAAACYLARDHGLHDIAVLEKGCVGDVSAGRGTAIIRSNRFT